LAAPIVFAVGGDSSPASIQATVDAFRAALGDPNNMNNPGTVGGRREINWDGGGSTATSPGGNPFNVFLDSRGSQFTTPGTDLVQAPDEGGLTGGLETFFGNATYGDTFSTFSPVRLFVPVGSNIVDASFFVPGTNGGVPATVSGFGAVFTDVDLLGSATLEFFDINNASLGLFEVPAGMVPDGSLSFLGVTFAPEQIARVRITSGTAALGPNDDPAGGIDIAAMDDFLYSEPIAAQQVPEPSIIALFGIAALVLASRLRRSALRR
jgi:hypothetical protein